jgi:hypothetical protein
VSKCCRPLDSRRTHIADLKRQLECERSARLRAQDDLLPLECQLREARKRGVQIWDYYLMIREGIFRIMSKELPERDKRIRAEAQAQLRESEARLRKANCDYGDGWLTDDLECGVDVEPWCGKHAVLYYIKALRESEAAQAGVRGALERLLRGLSDFDAQFNVMTQGVDDIHRQGLGKEEMARAQAQFDALRSLRSEWRRLVHVGEAEAILSSPSGLRCIDCNQALTGAHYGAGTGDGQRFRCERCHGLLDALKAVVARLRDASRGWHEHFHHEGSWNKCSSGHCGADLSALELIEQHIGGRDA